MSYVLNDNDGLFIMKTLYSLQGYEGLSAQVKKNLESAIYIFEQKDVKVIMNENEQAEIKSALLDFVKRVASGRPTYEEETKMLPEVIRYLTGSYF